MASTKESREVFYSAAFSLVSGVVMHGGIKPHEAEEDMSPTGATTVSHLMPECPPHWDTLRKINKNVGRLLMNHLERIANEKMNLWRQICKKRNKKVLADQK